MGPMNTLPLLVLGTANRKKGLELADLFAPLGLEVRTLADFGPLVPVAEDGATFAENARLKAAGYAVALKRWVLADDSGLAVDVLDGAPGVFSARYAGPEATDVLNNQRLLRELADVPAHRRGARFVCHMALADPGGAIRAQSDGFCCGRILFAARGPHGFGYDPLFEVTEYHRTFAELGPVVKAVLSHRARAAAAIIPALTRLVDGGQWS
jgi:XTP/dITP diphosphohydrolase